MDESENEEKTMKLLLGLGLSWLRTIHLLDSKIIYCANCLRENT